MSNKEDLQAMNNYVRDRSAPAAGAPKTIVDEWDRLRAKWNNWYPGIMSGWYVGDSDLAHGKAIRDALSRNQNPDAWEYVQRTAADKPDRLPYQDRPDAPGPQTKPWVGVGLKKSSTQVKALQEAVNAAGYKPALKVDGKYGPGTKAGEKWLALRGAAVKTEAVAKAAVAQVRSGLGLPKKTLPKEEKKVEAVPLPPATTILGIPINPKTVAGGVVGAVGGFLTGGPIGAAIGIPAGFLGVGAVTKGTK